MGRQYIDRMIIYEEKITIMKNAASVHDVAFFS